MIIRTSRILVEVLVGTCAVAAIAIAVGAWRLSQGPVSVNFATPHIKQALNPGNQNVAFDFEDTQLVWAGWERALDLRATNVTLRAPNGRLIARVPQVAVGFSISALLRGVLLLKTLDIIEPHIRLVRRENGTLDLGFGPDSRGSGSEFADLLDAILVSPEETGDSGHLEHVAVIDAELQVDDRKLGITWAATGVDARLRRIADTLVIELDANLALGGAPVHTAGDLTYLASNGRTLASLQLTGLNPPDLAARVPALSALANLAVPFDGSVAVTLDDTGAVLRGEGSFHGGSGMIKVPGLLPDGIAISGLNVEASYASDPRQIAIDRLRLDLGDATVELSGVATSVKRLASLNAQIVARDLSIKDLRKYWPERVSPSVRDWVLANITDGVLREARANLFARADPKKPQGIALDTVEGTLRIEDASIHYLRPMPPVSGVTATGTFDNKSVRFEVSGGRYSDLNVTTGRIDMEGLDRIQRSLSLTMSIDGPLRTALELLDHERLGYVSRLGINPQLVTGSASTTLSVALPLVADLKGDMIEYSARSAIEGAGLPAALRSLDASDGTLALNVDRSGLLIEGTGRLAGKPTQVSWSRNFDRNAPVLSRYHVTTVLDRPMQRALGIEFGHWIDGPLALRLDYKEVSAGQGEVSVQVGMDHARASFDLAGWSKPVGVPGAAVATGIIEKGKLVEIRDLDLRSDGLRIVGDVALNPDRQVRRVRLSQLRIAETNIALSVTQRADRGYDVAISGAAIDARPLIRFLGPGEGAALEPVPPISLAGRVDRLVLGAGTILEKADVTADVVGERLMFLDLSGAFGKKADISAVLTTDRGHQTFRARSADAGRTLGALDLTDNIVGGTLVVTAERKDAPGATWQGVAHAESFKLLKAPNFARVLSLASLEGIANALNNEGIEFNELDVPFHFNQSELAVHDARAVGSEIGVTMKGRIDRVAEIIEVDGTIVPAYTINSLLGRIPLIGPLVTGGAKGSGVFAATYKVAGTIDAPKVTVNPLAALAPGLLRRLISGPAPGEKLQTDLLEQNWPD